VLPSEQERADIARKRARWKSYQGRIDPKRLVFIAESFRLYVEKVLVAALKPGAHRQTGRA
jgi:hypothetical protein